MFSFSKALKKLTDFSKTDKKTIETPKVAQTPKMAETPKTDKKVVIGPNADKLLIFRGNTGRTAVSTPQTEKKFDFKTPDKKIIETRKSVETPRTDKKVLVAPNLDKL